jgi:hypothetical protein
VITTNGNSATSRLTYTAGSTPSSTQNAATPTVTVVVNHQSTNIGPIVGGVVGGIVGLAAIIGVIYFVYKSGREHGAQAAAAGRTVPPDNPLARNQGSLVDLEKKGLASSATRERETGTAREQGGSVETGQSLGNMEYGTASSGYVQARHTGDIVETISDVNVDLPSGRLRYPDGDDRR